MSRNIALVLVLVIAVAYAQDNCAKCKDMAKDTRTNFKNDFKAVTSDQLKTFMEKECDKQFSGFEKGVCKSKIDKDKDDILKAYQDGKTNDQICKLIHMCLL